MSVVPIPASSCSVLCTARQLSRQRHCRNAVRLAYEARTRGFCSHRSTDQASSTARVSASSGGIGSTMLAGLKKAFTKVMYLVATIYRKHVSQGCQCCNRSLTSQYNRVQPHHSQTMRTPGRSCMPRCSSGRKSCSGRCPT